MDEDGNIDFEGIKDKIPEKFHAPIQNMIEQCKSQASTF